jgi:hypothetical protein
MTAILRATRLSCFDALEAASRTARSLLDAVAQASTVRRGS